MDPVPQTLQDTSLHNTPTLLYNKTQLLYVKVRFPQFIVNFITNYTDLITWLLFIWLYDTLKFTMTHFTSLYDMLIFTTIHPLTMRHAWFTTKHTQFITLHVHTHFSLYSTHSTLNLLHNTPTFLHFTRHAVTIWQDTANWMFDICHHAHFTIWSIIHFATWHVHLTAFPPLWKTHWIYYFTTKYTHLSV